jgi:peptidoglycan-N-acetylglucosamine deacetylase
MFREIVLIIFSVIFLYWVLPMICTFLLGIQVLKKGKGQQVAFTFDDGPHPVYTPQLLDLLRRYRVKATFFVLGSQAEKYPGLILRMHLEGHLIGIHNYHHHCPNAFMTPKQIRQQVNQTAEIVTQITGIRPTYYRPPWGILNLFDLWIHRDFQIVLWSAMVGDWKRRGGSSKVKKRLLRRLKNGSIYLLHDSGETFGADVDAPENTLQALEEVFQIVLDKKYQCIRIDTMQMGDASQTEAEPNWNQIVERY